MELRVDTKARRKSKSGLQRAWTWGFVCEVAVLCGQIRRCDVRRAANSDGALRGACVCGFLLALRSQSESTGFVSRCVLTNMICCL